jgi:cyclopropane-fatty-acyl-phospholipid synthase
LRAAGTSPAAIARHYDVSDDFFRIWLGPELVYSCAWWDDGATDNLVAAQVRKLDWFAHMLGVNGGRVLDVGCGWGALLDRFHRHHGMANGIGITLSRAQARHASERRLPGVDFRVEHWADHDPDDVYDAVVCVEATEHLASGDLDPDEKVEVYQAFFARCAQWLRDGGRLGLQLICLDNASHAGTRAGSGSMTELIRRDIFPESMSGALSELAIGWETHFRLVQFLDHSDHYTRTFRAWRRAERENHEAARALVGDETARAFERYFSMGEIIFRLREQALYRVILDRRPGPKRWVTPMRPSALHGEDGHASLRHGASRRAVQTHYDVSNEFYESWLDASLMYTSGLWSGADKSGSLLEATKRKIDMFASCILPGPGARVLDVGCGWGGALRRLVDAHGAWSGIGLTLSAAQVAYVEAHPIPGVQVRLEGWEEHQPAEPYNGIVSFGAFEHFARDGSDTSERVDRYRTFFSSCFSWLSDGGRLGLETIAHDDAPDTASPLGRGPLGDTVLAIFPESICPHFSEIVLGFEPWFEVRLLRSDAADFAATCRAWNQRLRAHEADAIAAAGADTVRRFRQYLASSEVQFRLGAITNYRFVLQRRPVARS